MARDKVEVALVSCRQGCVDVDEDEERPVREDVGDGSRVDGGCDEVLLPVLGCVVQEGFYVFEDDGRVPGDLGWAVGLGLVWLRRWRG